MGSVLRSVPWQISLGVENSGQFGPSHPVLSHKGSVLRPNFPLGNPMLVCRRRLSHNGRISCRRATARCLWNHTEIGAKWVKAYCLLLEGSSLGAGSEAFSSRDGL